MSDIRLSTITGDIEFRNGDLDIVDGPDSVAQHVKQRLRFFRGEFFLNSDPGVPYFENILVKNPNVSVVTALLQNTILETPGVLELLEFDLDYDNSARRLTLDFTVRSFNGTIDFSGVTLGV